jgi:hypothetical protein
LVQVGGGQNTILNGQQPCTTDGDCPEGSTCLGTNLCEPVADFPVGTVLTGVAQPGGCGEAVIARGSLTVPGAEGTYTLSIAPGSLFANVIRHMETGEDFYATEAATPVIGGSLVIHADVPTGADFVSSIPAGSAPGEAPASSIWRNTNNVVLLTFSEDITAPGAGEVEVVEMLDGGTYGSDLSASFTFTVENDGGGDPRVLRVQEDGTVLAHRSWYAIRNNGAWSAANNFEIQWPLQVGDSNDDLRVLFNDLGVINGSVPCFSACDARLDINGDGRILFNDLGVANGSIPSFPVNKPEGH